MCPHSLVHVVASTVHNSHGYMQKGVDLNTTCMQCSSNDALEEGRHPHRPKTTAHKRSVNAQFCFGICSLEKRVHTGTRTNISNRTPEYNYALQIGFIHTLLLIFGSVDKVCVPAVGKR